jgi:hypothetical protein
VWGLSLQRRGEEIWLAEGVFDAIAVRGVALYGNQASAQQLQAILSLEPKRLVVALDNDVQNLAWSLQKRLRGVVETAVEFPPRGIKDFGELLAHGWRRGVTGEVI